MDRLKTLTSLNNHLFKPVSIAPLTGFRILFGAMLFVGTIRFMARGWIYKLYATPSFFFKFYGFEWVETGSYPVMLSVYCLVAISAFMIMLGWHYRVFSILFFLAFTYTELCDVTNYLNHYYFVSLMAFWLMFLPANKSHSLDVYFGRCNKRKNVEAWTIGVLKLQTAIVYFFAGYAKLNYDWLFNAMPLAAWLPEHSNLPIVGGLLNHQWVAYLFSWFGAIYDLSIVAFLLIPRTRPFAYLAVLVFHIFTGLLFNIGMFPIIMITTTLIFFSADFHERWQNRITEFLKRMFKVASSNDYKTRNKPDLVSKTFKSTCLVAFFTIQLLFPLRYLLYSGNVLWHEQGYRFSWRVMLVEKSGVATFKVEDPDSGRRLIIDNRLFLTEYQEKMMVIQPDLILQFAHYLEAYLQEEHHIPHPIIKVESHVALNGRISHPFIDPDVDLTTVSNTWMQWNWVLPE